METSTARRILLIPSVLSGLLISSLFAWSHTEPEIIPFELSRNHIFVRVEVNSRGNYLFLLDTGAGGTVIAADILPGIGMQQGEEAAAIGVGEGSSRALLLRNIRFQIGQVRFAPDAVFALSLDVISGVEGRKVDGVIGLDFFRDHVVEIDYRHRRLRLTDAGVQADLHHNAITLTFIDGLPIIDAIVTDNRNVAVRCQLEIDTGATRPLLLTSSFIASHSDFEFSSASLHVPLIGLGQVSTQRITRIGKLTIGPYAFEHPVTGISEAQSGLSARAGIDGMIGGELLARFRLVIDYAHQWIVFESENDIRRRFEYDMSGLVLLAEGPDLKKYVVRYVLPNSPAADAAVVRKN